MLYGIYRNNFDKQINGKYQLVDCQSNIINMNNHQTIG